MTPDDLSVPGWHFEVGADRGRAVIGGQAMDTDLIRAVITRIAAVRPSDIAHTIAPEDREYAASEMTAFLAAWLASLNARVLNAPSPVHLCGNAPSRRLICEYAARAGLTVRESGHEGATPVSCVDGEPFTRDPHLFAAAAAVAAAAQECMARIHLLREYGHVALAGYDHTVDLDRPEIGLAVLAACR